MSGGEQRKVSLDELRRAIELFDHPVCIIHDQRFLACNRAMLDATGYPPEELIGRHYGELLPPEERRRLSELSFRRAQGEALAELDFALMQTRSGAVLPLQLSVGRVAADDGRALALVSFLVATAQKAELDLAERLAGVATLLMAQRSPQSIRNAAVLAFERARLWAGFYAADKGALLPLVLSSAERAPAVDQVHAFHALYEHRPVFSAAGEGAQVAYLPLRGEEVLVLAGAVTPRSSGVLRLFAEQLAHAYSNAQLITDLEAGHREIQETRAAMVKRERLAALGELSAVLAHEVRNPLGVIFNAVSSLRRLLPKGDTEILIDILAEESDRLNRLVGELLDFARPRALSRQAEDVGRVIQDALDAASSDPASANARVRFVAEVEPELPPVPMDRRQIRQALVNVAVNALQSMPRGGSLRVLARRDGVGAGGGPQLRIDLSDDGPGIGPELLPRIFEPFFTTKAKGTGLGLAVVKRIIEDHEGTVEVRTEVGRGTTFTFLLPMQG